MAEDDARRGPLEDAYRRAEVVLPDADDESARQRRRAAVMAAVQAACKPAVDAAANQPAFASRPRKPYRPLPWLATAASIGLVSWVVWLGEPDPQPADRREQGAIAPAAETPPAPSSNAVAQAPAPALKEESAEASPATKKMVKAPPAPRSADSMEAAGQPVAIAPSEVPALPALPALAPPAVPTPEPRVARPASPAAPITAFPGERASPRLAQRDAAPAAAVADAPRTMLRARVSPVDQMDAEGRTALHRAVRAGNLALVLELMAQGANPKLADRYGITPLAAAIAADSPSLIEALGGTPP